MSQPSGEVVRDCPYCGARYRRTNWMKIRRGHSDYPDAKRNARYPARDSDGNILDDTHIASCYLKSIQPAPSPSGGRKVNDE